MKEIESEDERNLIIGHFAGHAKLDLLERMVFYDALGGRQNLHLDTFERLYRDLEESKADLIMIFDSCYSG